MNKVKVLSVLEFGNDKVEIIDITARQYSAAIDEYYQAGAIHARDTELRDSGKSSRDPGDRYDIIMYMVKHCCLFNGEKKDIRFIEKLKVNVYQKIQTELNKYLNENEQ